MVVNASTLGRTRTGTQNWLLLRASAIIIALYTFYIVSFIVTTDLNYTVWRTFFAFLITKIFTILTLISILIHAWIGLWQVLTDYVKSIAVRLSLQLFFIVILMTYLIYGTLHAMRERRSVAASGMLMS